MNSRKSLCSIFIIVLLLIFNSLHAQYKKYPAEIMLGVNGGMTGSMAYFKPAINQTYVLGNEAGLIFRYISEKNLGIQTELNFTQKGWGETSFERQMDYVEVPFMTHLYFGRKTRMFLNLGPKAGFLIADRVLLNTLTEEKYRHITPVFNKLEYGFTGGFGLYTHIKKQVFQLETRASFSMSNFFQDDLAGIYDNSNYLNVSVKLGWLLKLK